MIPKIKAFVRKTSFVFVAALIVAVYPASASADTTSASPIASQTTSQNTPTSGTPPPSSGHPLQQPGVSSASETPAQTETPTATQATTDTLTTDVSKTTPPNGGSVAQPQTSSQTTTTTNKATIDNYTTSTAQSGTATVDHNTTGGNAITGSSTAKSTTVSSLQSSSGFTGNGQVSTWTTDINGDQIGDVLLDPSQFSDLPVTNATTPTNLTVTTATNSKIDNDISLDAQSGDASVHDNGVGGSAISGNANAEASIINMVDSFVGADHTFVGTINITGNLNGDILLPGTTLANLLHAQQTAVNSRTTVTNDTTTTITNDVSVTATSGNASVSGNGVSGTATSGNAMTNINVINLTGQAVVAKNSMVVFVNALGRWVGFIVDAPAGATSAVLGDGVTANSINSGNAAVANRAATSINNRVTVNAASGNASVDNNGVGGSATTGKATATANILNMADDDLSLGGWFGVLFINVLGAWTGSFGVDTAAGTLPAPKDTTPVGSAQIITTPAASTNNSTTQNAVLAAQAGTNSAGGTTSTNETTNDPTQHTAVLGASQTPLTTPTVRHNAPNWRFAAAGVSLSLLMLISERLLGRAAKRSTSKKAQRHNAMPEPSRTN